MKIDEYLIAAERANNATGGQNSRGLLVFPKDTQDQYSVRRGHYNKLETSSRQGAFQIGGNRFLNQP